MRRLPAVVRIENGPMESDRYGRRLYYVYTENGVSIDPAQYVVRSRLGAASNRRVIPVCLALIGVTMASNVYAPIGPGGIWCIKSSCRARKLPLPEGVAQAEFTQLVLLGGPKSFVA